MQAEPSNENVPFSQLNFHCGQVKKLCSYESSVSISRNERKGVHSMYQVLRANTSGCSPACGLEQGLRHEDSKGIYVRLSVCLSTGWHSVIVIQNLKMGSLMVLKDGPIFSMTLEKNSALAVSPSDNSHQSSSHQLCRINSSVKHFTWVL